MSDLKTPVLEIDKIDVQEGFNARSHMDEGELDNLAGSIGTAGLVQPVVVRPTKDGRAVVVAGHRRLEAAKRAGLRKVPIALSKGNAHLNSLIENIHQEKLDPIDTARGLKAVMGEFNLTTHKQLAEQVNKKVPWVSERLRLLDLPEAVQTYIAAGDVPIEAERLLRKIAEVSPRIAECICKVAKRDKVKGRAFIVGFDDLFRATGEASLKDKPTMLSTRGFEVSAAITNRKKRKELSDRLNALDKYFQHDDPTVRFGDAEIDAARAAGCLVEHRVERRGYVSSTAFITDREFAADLVERAVDRLETEARKRTEEDAAWRERQGQTNGSTEAQKEVRKKARERDAQRKVSARFFNGELGRNMLQKRTAARRKKHSLARAKAVAHVLIADNPQLAGNGVRLVWQQLQEIEVKTLKSGAERTKVHFADAEQCQAELIRRVEAATTADGVLEVLSEALIAGLIADDRELAQSRRIYWSASASKPLEKLLAADIKELRPRRTARKQAA